jgi:hypothetical protein
MPSTPEDATGLHEAVMLVLEEERAWNPNFQLLPDAAEAIWGLLWFVFTLLPLTLAIVVFLFVKLNRMERKLDGALERLRNLQSLERP